MEKEVRGKKLTDWLDKFPLLKEIVDYRPVIWLNDKREKNTEKIGGEIASFSEIEDAVARWQRFAPYLETTFPELQSTAGKVESPLHEILCYKQTFLPSFFGDNEKLYIKCDHLLPVAGSIKARGGFYEVLKLAERLALENNFITKGDDYRQFTDNQMKDFFSDYTIGVGSTGNLALSIGIIGTRLGFHVDVFISRDAKQWKKELLKNHGANVYEYSGDFGKAIASGREKTLKNPNGYFIDDENSKDLFLGYSVAALELKKQLEERNVEINADNPLFVYLPCGVGGSPGGITFGLKKLFGNHVHSFFAEPTHSPSVLLGLMTELGNQLSVQDFGLDNITLADGLAVGRPSSFATSISSQTVSGIYTEEDKDFCQMGMDLWKTENLFVEPSSAAGLSGPKWVDHAKYREREGIAIDSGTHVVWSTGGSLVPEEEQEKLYNTSKETDLDV